MMHVLQHLAALKGDERFVVLTADQAAAIDRGARRVVDELGFKVDHPVVLERIRARGYRVDGNVVRLRGREVEDLLSRVPKTGDARGTGPGTVRVGYLANQIYDADLDAVRYPTRADLDAATVVGLSLPEVGQVTALFEPKDRPGHEDVLMADVILRRVREPHRMDILNRGSIARMLRMAEIAAGSRAEALRRRTLMYHAFITTPLCFAHDTLDFALEVLAQGVWVRFGASMAVAGVSAPVTLAGTLTMALAEAYAGMLLADLYGQPWEPGMAPIVMDQRTGASLYCGPDRALLCLAARDLYRHIGVEMGHLGPIGHLTASDTCRPGLQTGIEKAYTAMLNLLVGAPPFISHGGMIGPGGLVASIEQIVIDCEIMSILNRLVGGIRVDDESIAADLIIEQGFTGRFMDHDHTVANFRQELWFPNLMRRLNPSAWNREKPEMLEEARKQVKRIVASNDPRALDAAQEKELDAVVSGAGGTASAL